MALRNTFGALLDRRVGQADDDRLLEPAPGDIDLDLAENALDAFERHAMQPREHTPP